MTNRLKCSKQMELCSKEISITTKDTERAQKFTLMVVNLLVDGHMIRNKEKAYCLTKMDKNCLKEIGRKT